MTKSANISNTLKLLVQSLDIQCSPPPAVAEMISDCPGKMHPATGACSRKATAKPLFSVTPAQSWASTRPPSFRLWLRSDIRKLVETGTDEDMNHVQYTLFLWLSLWWRLILHPEQLCLAVRIASTRTNKDAWTIFTKEIKDDEGILFMARIFHIADLQGIHEVILRSGWFALKSLQQVKVFHTSCYRGNRGQKRNSELSSLCRVTASTNLSTMSTRRTCCLNLFLHKSQNLSLGLSLSPRNCQNPCLANIRLSSEARLVRPCPASRVDQKWCSSFVLEWKEWRRSRVQKDCKTPSSPPSGFPSTGSIEKSEICEHRMIPDLTLRHSDQLMIMCNLAPARIDEDLKRKVQLRSTVSRRKNMPHCPWHHICKFLDRSRTHSDSCAVREQTSRWDFSCYCHQGTPASSTHTSRPICLSN